MGTWDVRAIKRVSDFCEMVRWHESKDVLIMEYRPKDVAPSVVDAFKVAFPWQYDDTQRSYTQMLLRKHGNRGKREDFAYMNRAATYFGYDQFEAHRKQPNKLICLWNPADDGDMVGEHNPCLVMVKFKQNVKKLDMVATFRKRDMCKRMIGNMVFLSLWLNENAALWKLDPGTITDFSMEATWNEDDLKKLEGKR